MLNLLLMTIGSGANLFIIIVVLLLAFGAGISATDFLKQKDKEKDYEGK